LTALPADLLDRDFLRSLATEHATDEDHERRAPFLRGLVERQKHNWEARYV